MLDHDSDVSIDYDYTNTMWFLNSEIKGGGAKDLNSVIKRFYKFAKFKNKILYNVNIEKNIRPTVLKTMYRTFEFYRLHEQIKKETPANIK